MASGTIEAAITWADIALNHVLENKLFEVSMKGLKADLLDQLLCCHLGQSESGSWEAFAGRAGGVGEKAMQPPDLGPLGLAP